MVVSMLIVLHKNKWGKVYKQNSCQGDFQLLADYILCFCLAWVDCRWLGDLAAHINLNSGTSLLIYLEEENKQKQSLTHHCSCNTHARLRNCKRNVFSQPSDTNKHRLLIIILTNKFKTFHGNFFEQSVDTRQQLTSGNPITQTKLRKKTILIRFSWETRQNTAVEKSTQLQILITAAPNLPLPSILITQGRGYGRRFIG